MTQNKWIALSYTLPREPSRARVSVWRKLKKLGAVGIWQSMWVLPGGEENRRLLSEMKEEVVRCGGEAFTLEFSADKDGEQLIVDRFTAARGEEYEELFEQCEDFFAEIERETARQNFSFAEIEENEEELDKLRLWYEKIAARDTLGSPFGEKAKAMLAKCAELLDGFCEQVYAFTELSDENRGQGA
ncbi:MAG TPA: Chromate resistance protein ChrB [Candidatus Acidoferrum sp.]|nr:Chromate resistance protein ChrB [Candidatus Acidoferrum sp.]